MNEEAAFPDPRTLAQYDETLVPLCDGEDLPPQETNDRQLRRVIEFASIYYQMNQLRVLAEAARDTGNAVEERQLLERIRSVSRQRDALEDRYAPEGFLAEPVMDGDRCIDLKFNWAGKEPTDSAFRRRFKTTIEF